ncbi:MAG: YtxH domain-containing protein [Saprospiraceae bacterium]|nr:YtxH domain-containing protein [Saprospiraceae bacterium]
MKATTAAGYFWPDSPLAAVVGYLINSDKGRQVRTEAATKVVEYGGQAREFAQEKVATVASTVSSIIEKGKAYASEVSTKLQDRIKSSSENAQDVVEGAETAFQQGATKAKNHLQEISAS